jgi:hypothetical protein
VVMPTIEALRSGAAPSPLSAVGNRDVVLDARVRTQRGCCGATVTSQLRPPSSVESVGNEEAHGLGLALPVGRGGVLVTAAGDLPQVILVDLDR